MLLAWLFVPRQATPTALSHKVSETKVSTVVKADKPVPTVKTPIGVKTSDVSKKPQSVNKPKANVNITKPTPSPRPTTHTALMAAAGIPSKDYGAADYIISHESSWDPDATEPTTQAHGLVQALPYSKTGCGWSDEVCQLKWANIYAVSHYGSWWGAYDHWVSNRWW